MVTQVRQRVTRQLLDRRGTSRDAVWVNRRLLLTGAEHLSAKQWRRLNQMLDSSDPTKEISAAWAVKERLRMLLAEREPSKMRLADFYEAAIDAQLPEATRLAETIQTWWPAILVPLIENVSNARTEGFNRVIKQTKRVGCGYRQRDQLSAAYPHPHRGHPTAKISSMNGSHPAQVRRARLTRH
jgi:transposase